MSNVQNQIAQTLQQAVAHHQAGDLETAARLYSDILKIAPKHADALHLLGLVHHASGNIEQALDLITQALAINPGFSDAWFNLGNVYQSGSQPEKALEAFAKCLGITPSHPGAHYNSALIYLAQNNPDEAENHFAQAVEGNPNHHMAQVGLASCYKNKKELDKAKDILNTVLQNIPNHPHALKALADILKQQHKKQEADERYHQALVEFDHLLEQNPMDTETLFQRATLLLETEPALAIEDFLIVLERAPEKIEAWQSLAQAYSKKKRHKDALTAIDHALKTRPESIDLLNDKGAILVKAEKYEDAIQVYQNLLALNHTHKKTNASIGACFINLKEYEKALEYFEQEHRLQPENDNIELLKAKAFYKLGETEKAAALLDKVIAKNGENAEILHKIGDYYMTIKEGDAALKYVTKAINLKPENPDYLYQRGLIHIQLEEMQSAANDLSNVIDLVENKDQCLGWLGIAYEGLGDFTKARQCFNEALELHPENSVATMGLGIIHFSLGEFAKAEEFLKKSLNYDQKNIGAYDFLSHIARDKGDDKKAREYSESAITIEPEMAEAYTTLSQAYSNQGRLEEASRINDKALELDSNNAIAWANKLFNINYYPDIADEEVFATYQEWAKHFMSRYKKDNRPYLQSRDLKRPLRIGFISPDFNNHVCHYFTEPLIAHLDQTRFDVYLYSQTKKEDDVTDRFIGYAKQWRKIRGANTKNVADTIRQDEIDILVDLAGHTHENRLDVMKLKPAPVQVTWIGYGYTTGLEEIDYFLTDPIMVPEGYDHLFSEAPWRLPTTWAAFRGSNARPFNPDLPALKNGYVTFGSMTRLIRINDRVIATWARILKEIPNSKLIINTKPMACEETRGLFISRFADHDITPDRLNFYYETPPWDTYGKIDISLDPFPHNTGTTTYDSLWLGVPTITKKDRPSVGRIGASILTAAGLEDWVAEDEDQYVEIAKEKAADLNALQELRKNMRERLATSPIQDEKGFARDVGDAFREMWAIWCRSKI